MAAILCLLAMQFRSLERLEAAARGPAPVIMERVFNFPSETCAPKPQPIVAGRPEVPRSANLASLARAQYRDGLLLGVCMLGGLCFGVVVTHRSAAREMRLVHLKSAFLSNVSHEMKTPLAVIQMHSETLELSR